MNQQPQFDFKKLRPLIFIVFAVFLLLSVGKFWITIQPGERGVIFRKFSTGLDKENIFKPGFTLIAPWNEMFVYEVKEQKEEEEMMFGKGEIVMVGNPIFVVGGFCAMEIMLRGLGNDI